MTRHRRRKKHSEGSLPEHKGPVVATHNDKPPERVKPVQSHAREESQKKISWRAAEFHYIEKDYLWYVAVVSVGVLLLVFALVQKSFFYAVFVVIATTLVVEFGKRRPRVLDYEINEKGVLIDGKIMIPYKNIESFHVRKRLGFLDEIVFKRTSRVNPFIHIPIDEDMAVRARSFLSEYLTEDEHERTMVEIIEERIGF